MNIQKKGSKLYFLEIRHDHLELLKVKIGLDYDVRSRCYTLAADPIFAESLLKLHNGGAFKLPPDIVEWAKNARLVEYPDDIPLPKEYASPTSDKYRLPPKNYQMAALKKLHNLEFALLGMDMGTGKTKTTIELLDINKEKYDQILIICPISVRGAWVEQVKKYSINDSDVRILGVSTKKEQDDYKNWNDESTKATKWLIIGTESIGASLKTQKILTEYVKKRRTALVVDESHYFSNHTAFRTKYMMETAPKCVLRYFLTGTKIVKHLGDLFPTLTMMSPDILGTSNFYTFRAKYLITNEVPIGSNRSIKAIIGVKNEEEFLKKINRFVFICKKDDVLDLPKKRYKTLTLPVEKEHVKYLRNVKKMILEESNSTVLHKIQMIKAAQRIFAGYYNTQTETGMVKTPIFSPKKDPKLRTALQIVRDHDGQIIIWAASRYQIESMTKLMQEEKISCASFYGATPKEDRQDIIKGFQAGRYKVIVANPSVGGSGIELTNADLVIYLSNTHNYGDRAQSEDRCHRIGQTKSVLYIDIVYQNTYDVVILQALQEKKDLSRVLDALQLENHIGC